MTFTIEIADELVADLRVGIRNGGILPGRGTDVGKHVRSVAYAQIVAKLSEGDVAHRHADAALIARTPPELRDDFAALRGELATGEKP